MKLYEKKSLDEQIGKKGLSYKQVGGKLTYVSGIPEMDAILEGKSFLEVPSIANVLKRENGIEISIMYKFKQYFTAIKNSDLIGISFENKEQIFQLKNKSVIGRAIVGGLLLGPVGAVIGGMTGIGDKQVGLNMPDLLLTFKFKNIKNEDDFLILSSSYKNQKDVNDFFVKHFKTFYNIENC